MKRSKQLLNDHEDCPNQQDNSQKLWNETYHFEFDRKSIESKAIKWPKFFSGGKAIVEQILVS